MEKENRFFNREISWLQFNERVLQEAIDERTPLIERLKFLGIFSNNRDEFFRVRVATHKRLLKYQQDNNLDFSASDKLLEEIATIVHRQEKVFTATYRKIVKKLETYDIYIVNETKLTEFQGQFVKDYFQHNVRPYLYPLMLDNIRSLSSLKDTNFCLAVDLKSSDPDIDDNYALIQVPSNKISRFIILPEYDNKKFVILLDDLIRYCLSDMFEVFGYDEMKAYTIKFTRDAEMDLDADVSKSFLEIISESVKRRKKGQPVRFVYDESIPTDLLRVLKKRFNLGKSDHFRAGGRYHNFKDFMSFPKIGPKELVFAPTPPLPHPELNSSRSLFDIIREKDRMLHFPYQSFHYITDLLREASIDPLVKGIKMTFYRAAKDSNVMNALINAARNGKKVTVFMELQARFDEEANIYWTSKLQEEDVKIIQTIPGFKVHSKLISIRRKENGENIYYANISTGNFNESTAKVYADESLLTADQRIAAEVNEVFHLMESKFILPSFNTLIVAPFNIRNFFMERLEKEIEHAKAGKEAWAILKLNSIVDKKISRKLYEASQAGVKIKLICRGICVLKPGIPGISENIEAVSIVDKFLEHSRIYVFCNEGDNQYFITSADWMQRNFDHRIEVATPVFDKDLQNELLEMLNIQMRDNVKSRYLDVDRLNQYRITDAAEEHRSQFETYEYFESKL